ncbi:MAG: endonuclease [Bacteroidia bacterium]|nr:endonuclease [Bacteroidia bacterium]
MYKWSLGFWALLGAICAQAQPLVPHPAQLQFGVAYENAPASLPLTLVNPHDYPVSVSGVQTFGTYGKTAFRVSDSVFTILPLDSVTLTVTFQPRHNIYHNSELVFLTGNPLGSLRVDVQGQGRYSQTYYSATENLSEQALKNALKTRLAQGFISLSYNTARDKMFMEIDNKKVNGQGATVNTVECVYTGRVITGYIDRTAAQSQSFNTEHTFPQGFFNQDQPMRSDLFHLFPTDEAANAQRGNLPFGTVTSPSWQVGGSEAGNGLFEPRTVHKGPVARAMMYFVIRYENYQGFLTAQETVLRQWHQTYLPDSAEHVRNAAIYLAQGNRNPFIDYPQLLERITSISVSSVAPPAPQAWVSATAADLDTVYTGHPATYSLVWVNHGNVPLQVHNFSLSHPALHLDLPLQTDTTLQPGEALPMHLTVAASVAGEIRDTLRFATGAPGQAAVSIPIHAIGAFASGRSWTSLPGCQVYPVPAHDQLSVRWAAWGVASATLELLDFQGRTLRQVSSGYDQMPVSLDVAGLAPGRYLLRILQGGSAWTGQVEIR